MSTTSLPHYTTQIPVGVEHIGIPESESAQNVRGLMVEVYWEQDADGNLCSSGHSVEIPIPDDVNCTLPSTLPKEDRTPHEETDVPSEGISDRTSLEETDVPSKRFSNKSSFATFLALGSGYQLIPGFFFLAILVISVLCGFSSDSITAQQVGDGRDGLGFLSFSFNLPFASDFTGDPLCTPRFVLFNVFAGCFIIFYMVTPSINWTNSFKTKLVPILSAQMYDPCERIYNFSRILKDDGLTLNEEKYMEYSPIHFGAFKITSICFMVALVSTGLVHVAMNFGR